jgi:hypothetical protein
MYQTQYKEVGSSTDMQRVIQESVNAGPPPLEFLIIRGHGNPEGIRIGKDFVSNASFLEGVSMPSDAKVLLDSCSTGAGKHTVTNFANKVANALPGRTVFANTAVVSSLATTIDFDQQQNKLQIRSQNPSDYKVPGDILYTVSKEKQQELCTPGTGRPLNEWCNFVESKSKWW